MKRQIRALLIIFVAILFLLSCKQYENPSIVHESVISNNSMVLIKTSVKIAVSGIVYENLDAQLKVTGFDANDRMVWAQDYNYSGLEDTLSIRSGFHHYNIELLNKWGITDIQSAIPGNDIWNGRADGPLPVTYGLGGSKNARRLASLVTSREVDNPVTGLSYELESKVSYQYKNNHIASIHHETYNPETQQFDETMVETFAYNGNTVSTITTTLNGQPYADYQYEYGTLDKITETNHSTGIVTTQLIRRNYDTNPNDSSISVLYSFSNGNSLIYDFRVMFKNISTDRTRKTDQVCNLGSYVYDKNINPFRHLGYLDFGHQNYSANNKTSNHIDFIGCEYPSVFPLFYYYTYDQDGYPTSRITTYKSHANQNTAHHTREDFYYE